MQRQEVRGMSWMPLPGLSPAEIPVASLVWGSDSVLHAAQGEVIEALGYPHAFFHYDEPIPPDSKIVLVQGPYGSLLPLVQQLQTCPPDQRPLFVYWFQQSMRLYPAPSAMHCVSRLFSDLYRANGEAGWLGQWIGRLPMTRHRGHRLRYLSEILWLKEHDLLDVLALSSSVYATWLADLGAPSVLVPRGYHPSYGHLLGGERDIAVVWMGKTRTRRRKRAIYWLQEQLEQRGQRMVICDNEQHHFIFGDERTRLLNRTHFVLNAFFSGPNDELSIRYFIAGANGAVVITEPGTNRYPFVPGEHIVECAIEEMPDHIMYYLEHKAAWQALSNHVVRLLQEDLTLERSLACIMSAAQRKMACSEAAISPAIFR